MKSLTHLWVALTTYATPQSRKADTGATMLEYAAIVILVAGIVAAITALAIPSQISQSIMTSITTILSTEP
ncbi:hypothetical protein [Nocardiopsis sp. YSL2]|uniref:hypothetical protein n=1 Tax=Nocardiopsis sp. YSL2 TaxID=2939492 RepID=UPI0026F416BE|nr:hypothetical protein [Nocardiopsis sp. YSL2]